MNKLNENIPHFKAKIKKSFLTKNPEDDKEFYNVICFGIQSIAGKILTFHVITDNGMVRSRVPLSEIYIKESVQDIPFHYKQLWDCFSENVAITKYSFLQEKRTVVNRQARIKIFFMMCVVVLNVICCTVQKYYDANALSCSFL